MEERLTATREKDKYALSPEALKALTRELLEERPPTGDHNEVCYRLDGDDRFADIARTVECQVFDSAFGNDPEVMVKEYGDYEGQSTFMLTVDTERGEPTGAFRKIKNGPKGLKSINDLLAYLVEEEGLPEDQVDSFVEYIKAFHGIEDFDDCEDLGTAAVLPEHRLDKGGLTTPIIYRAMHVDGELNGTKHLISMIDAKAHQNLTARMGIPFEPLAGIGPIEGYIGSKKTYPVYGKADEFVGAADRKGAELIARYASHPAYVELLRNIFSILTGKEDDALQFTVNKEALKLE